MGFLPHACLTSPIVIENMALQNTYQNKVRAQRRYYLTKHERNEYGHEPKYSTKTQRLVVTRRKQVNQEKRFFCLDNAYSQTSPHIMEWKEEYSVGITEIDNQHKLLLRSFSIIEESAKLNQGWSNTHYATVELRQLAYMHFSFEEAMMRMFGYPGTEVHQKEHLHFFDSLNRIERAALRNSADVEMIRFLQGWLVKHMLGSDKGYAKHICSGAQVVRSSFDPSQAED